MVTKHPNQGHEEDNRTGFSFGPSTWRSTLSRALIGGEVAEGAEVKFSVKDDELVMND
jgi:hypothetical protein